MSIAIDTATFIAMTIGALFFCVIWNFMVSSTWVERASYFLIKFLGGIIVVLLILWLLGYTK